MKLHKSDEAIDSYMEALKLSSASMHSERCINIKEIPENSGESTPSVGPGVDT